MTGRTKSTPIIIVCARCKRERPRHGRPNLCKSCYGHLRKLERFKDAPLKKCACSPECPEMIRSWDRTGRPLTYAKGHVAKLIRGKKRGKGFKGGLRPRAEGYYGILFHNHPFADRDGYIMFHRIVYEMYYKCCLLPWTDIHHIDGNKKRNHPENLEGMMHGQHSSITNGTRKHKKKRMRRKCLDCGSSKTTKSKDDYYNWYKTEVKRRFRCQKCHDRLRRKKIIIT